MTVVRIRLAWPVRILIVAAILLVSCSVVGSDVQPEATHPAVSEHAGMAGAASFSLPASGRLARAQTSVLEDRESETPQVRPAPAFTLPSATGEEVSLASFRGTRSVVLVFYRAFW